MSKYQILTNTDCNNDGSTTTTTATTTKATLTDDDDDENYGIFYRTDNNDQLRLNNNNHHHSNNIQRQQHNNHHHYNNHYFDDDDDFHHNDIHPHTESLSSTGNHVEDLIQYNNDDDSSTIISDTKQSVNNNSNTNITGKVIIMNGNRNHNNNSTSNIKTNTNNLMAELNAAEANDSTMEIPLLHQDHQHHHHQNNNSNGMNYNKQLDFEYVCLCQQKGFASNLNNNSTQTAKSKILWAIALCCIFMIVEFLGGYIAGSLAIMTDAAHLASDCISFVIGLVAIWLGSRPPDAKMSFGYKRLEVMGAIVSILGIWILTATLVLVAIQRIYSNDYDLDANTMMTISGIGILINIIMIFILHTSVLDLPAGSIGSSHGHSHNHSHHGHSHSHSSPSLHRRRRHSNNDGNHLHSELSSMSLVTTDSDATADAAVVDSGEATSIELSSAPLVLNGNDFKHQQDGKEKNLNLRAAMIHVIGDLVQSFGVFIASILIKIYPKAVFLDPLCTLLFSVIVVMTTINLFKESMHLIMDSVPQGLSIDNLEIDLLDIEGVKSVHHLNVWNHTSNHSILMVHLVIDFLADSNTVLLKATQLAASVKYNIKHSTIQIERVTT